MPCQRQRETTDGWGGSNKFCHMTLMFWTWGLFTLPRNSRHSHSHLPPPTLSHLSSPPSASRRTKLETEYRNITSAAVTNTTDTNHLAMQSPSRPLTSSVYAVSGIDRRWIDRKITPPTTTYVAVNVIFIPSAIETVVSLVIICLTSPAGKGHLGPYSADA